MPFRHGILPAALAALTAFCPALARAASSPEADAAPSSPSEKGAYTELLFGYGTSHPGWGDTTERVETFDVLIRRCIPIVSKNDGWIRGRHECWIEIPFAFLLSDSDSNDAHDVGLFGVDVLAVWIFPEVAWGCSPYLLAGGGPIYLAADVEGMGNNLCGNYQFGGGVRVATAGERNVDLELRFHHVSNMGAASPNRPLNSTKLYLGASFPF